MGLPTRRKATKSPKNKRKGTKGGGTRPRVGGLPGGMPALPPGLDPGALDPNAFKAPKLDFGKLTRRKDEQ